ncbi:MAG: hypothetical protein A2Z81_04210 [Omnitrophica WOR_2 bacterium GWA2_45_18]|nr:MAG: hypothetical protein A2Z81_04210 [Omnitrophica WOR_2 bacterium GWA2_45_18]
MRKMFLLILAGMLLYGCASTMWDIDRNRNNLMKLEVSMSKEQVIDIMGQPYNREAYTTPDGSVLEFLIYLTKYTDSGSIPDSDTTPICFLNDKVTGWGRNFYISQKQRYEIEIK